VAEVAAIITVGADSSEQRTQVQHGGRDASLGIAFWKFVAQVVTHCFSVKAAPEYCHNNSTKIIVPGRIKPSLSLYNRFLQE
jgi:hypothetical protein